MRRLGALSILVYTLLVSDFKLGEVEGDNSHETLHGWAQRKLGLRKGCLEASLGFKHPRRSYSGV